MRDPKKITAERLKDRRDYRNALIDKRGVIDGKIDKVEEEIRKLSGK
jgi:hypothetical protein